MLATPAPTRTGNLFSTEDCLDNNKLKINSKV